MLWPYRKSYLYPFFFLNGVNEGDKFLGVSGVFVVGLSSYDGRHFAEDGTVEDMKRTWGGFDFNRTDT